ncbi:MAG: spore protease YyaC [Clostridium sp.]
MSDYLSIDSSLQDAYCIIRDYLCKELKSIIKSKREIIFLCIGTDRCTGDCLGPLVGDKLKFLNRSNIYIYGTLENPIHSKNLETTLSRIKDTFENPYIIGVDACLGGVTNIGKIFIEKKALNPGKALNKELPSVGEMSITGIVNLSGNYEFIVLQNTRLHTVMSLAECISKGIYHFTLKSCGGKQSTLDDKLDDLLCTNSSN